MSNFNVDTNPQVDNRELLRSGTRGTSTGSGAFGMIWNDLVAPTGAAIASQRGGLAGQTINAAISSSTMGVGFGGSPTPPPGYPGVGGGSGGGGAFGIGGGGLSDYQNQIDGMFNQTLALFSVQQKMQMQANMFQLVSTMESKKADTHRAMIQNIK